MLAMVAVRFDATDEYPLFLGYDLMLETAFQSPLIIFTVYGPSYSALFLLKLTASLQLMLLNDPLIISQTAGFLQPSLKKIQLNRAITDVKGPIDFNHYRWIFTI